jgi:hypothetical protein
MVPEAGKRSEQVRWEGRNTAEWGTTSERNKKGQMMCGRDEGELSFGREDNIYKICNSTPPEDWGITAVWQGLGREFQVGQQGGI